MINYIELMPIRAKILMVWLFFMNIFAHTGKIKAKQSVCSNYKN